MQNYKLPVRNSQLNAWATVPELLDVSRYTLDALFVKQDRPAALYLGELWERFKKLLAQFDMLGDEVGEEIESFCAELVNGRYLSEAPLLGKYWPPSQDEPSEFEYQDDKLKAALEECRDALLLLIYEGYDE